MVQFNPAVADLERYGIIFPGAMDFLPRHAAPKAGVGHNGGPAMDSAWGGVDEAKFRMAMDAVTPNNYVQQTLVTQPNAAIMAMLTTYIDPKLIEVLLGPMKAEEIYGVTQKGSWITQTAAFGVIENTGEATAYGDFSADGRSDINVNWPQRQSFNFQTFTEWGDMEVERYGLARVEAIARKNLSSANTLRRLMNLIYFYGVPGLQNYGGLNDPSLAPALTPALKAAGGTSWQNALPQEILADVQAAYASLQSGVHGTGGNLDLDTPMTLALSPTSNTYIVNTNSFGMVARGMLKTAFPNLTIKTAPQYQSGNTYSFQLIVDSLEGQQTCEAAFNERMRAHRMVMDTSSMRQKKSAGCWGTIIYRPICIASMSGI